MSEDRIFESLGLRPLDEIPDSEKTQELTIVEEETSELVVPGSELNDELIADIDTAKQNVDKMLTSGSRAVTEMLSIATQSENPKMFEVAALMMKTLLDGNKDLVGLAEKKKYAKEDHSTSTATTNNITNNNLVLSTADLLKMIKGN